MPFPKGHRKLNVPPVNWGAGPEVTFYSQAFVYLFLTITKPNQHMHYTHIHTHTYSPLPRPVLNFKRQDQNNLYQKVNCVRWQMSHIPNVSICSLFSVICKRAAMDTTTICQREVFLERLSNFLFLDMVHQCNGGRESLTTLSFHTGQWQSKQTPLFTRPVPSIVGKWFSGTAGAVIRGLMRDVLLYLCLTENLVQSMVVPYTPYELLLVLHADLWYPCLCQGSSLSNIPWPAEQAGAGLFLRARRCWCCGSHIGFGWGGCAEGGAGPVNVKLQWAARGWKRGSVSFGLSARPIHSAKPSSRLSGTIENTWPGRQGASQVEHRWQVCSGPLLFSSEPDPVRAHALLGPVWEGARMQSSEWSNRAFCWLQHNAENTV